MNSSGTVKVLNRERMFGFIAADDGGEVFFGGRVVEEMPDLHIGERVSFRLVTQRDGRTRAIDVRKG